MSEFRLQQVSGLASVIVVNWNGIEYIAECIESVLEQTYRPLELIVVDNGSRDGSLDYLGSLPSGSVNLIRLPSNRGFAGGTNAGVCASRGEFVALLNNDAVADCCWLGNLIASLTPEAGMVASKILFYNRRDVIDKTGHLFYPDGLNRGRGAGDPDRGQFDQPGEILFPDGCAALYRRKMLEEIGLFDEQFFAYGDDADLGLRARWRGWNCRYAPGAVVYHRHSSSLGKYSPEKAFLVERNRLWVALKLLPLRLLILTPGLTLWRLFWHAASLASHRGLAGGVRRDHSAWELLRAGCRAYIDAIRGLPEILRKRRAIMRGRTLTTAGFLRLLRQFRVSARELAFRD
jgi:GT2 family glycosyltransferase